jgi:hypothetical protein
MDNSAAIQDMIERTRRDSVRCLLADMALVSELVKRASSSDDRETAKHNFRQAVWAYKAVLKAAERLKLRLGQRAAIDSQLIALREQLLAMLPSFETLH